MIFVACGCTLMHNRSLILCDYCLLPDDQQALGLVRLSIYIGALISVLVAVGLYLFGPNILALLHAETILEFVYLIPVFMFSTVLSSVASQWLIRKKEFALTAKVTVWQMLFTNMMKAGFGYIYPTAGMLIGTNTLNIVIGALMMALGMRQKPNLQKDELDSLPDTPSLFELSKRYSDFPLLRAPQVLINSISFSLPVVVLSAHFGPASVGYYSVASAVLGVPVVLIGASVMQVFYPRITEAIHQGEDVKALLIKATLGLAVSGILPFVLIVVGGPWLFGLIFGAEWETAGVYAQWLSLWLFLQFLNKPVVSAIPALRLQKEFLIYELFSTASKIAALYIGYAYFGSDVYSIALLSVVGAAAYIWLIVWVIFRSGKACYNN